MPAIAHTLTKTAEDGKVVTVLEVESNLSGINEACEALWAVILLLNMNGKFILHVNYKITGQVLPGKLIRVMKRIDFNLYQVLIKFQSAANMCFEGTLRHVAPDGTQTTGNELLDSLRKVTGHTWFDPDKPTEKQVVREFIKRGLTSVDGGLPPEVARMGSHGFRMPRGLSPLMQQKFGEMAALCKEIEPIRAKMKPHLDKIEEIDVEAAELKKEQARIAEKIRQLTAEKSKHDSAVNELAGEITEEMRRAEKHMEAYRTGQLDVVPRS